MSEVIRGTPVSPGLAAGRVFIADAAPDEVRAWTIHEGGIEEEIAKLERATEKAVESLHSTRDEFLESGGVGEQEARIFDVHAELIRDPTALEQMNGWIRADRLTAEAAVERYTASAARRFADLVPGGMAGIVSDIEDAFSRVRAHLLQIEKEDISAAEGGVILIAEDLTPSLTTMFPRRSVLGIVTERGGRFSHGAVLARSLAIPTVVGVRGVHKQLSTGETILVDGEDGSIEIEPPEDRLKKFLERKERLDALKDAMVRRSRTEARIGDGERVQIHVNIESVKELGELDIECFDGVGLCRTEFIYSERAEFPSEDEQVEIYREILETMKGRPVVFRTLDTGNDKRLPYFGMPSEGNPALGWRGLRISLRWRDLFLVQLRALLRAAVFGPARILLPMVTMPEEVFEVRSLLDQLEADLAQEGVEHAPDVPLGVMIEVPSAIYGVGLYASAIDFVSIGTNDLVQYLLAVDRDNKWVASMYDPHHPIVIRAITDAFEAAKEHDLSVSVCGEMAGMVDTALVLVALGIRELSMSRQFVPEVKLILSQLQDKDLQELRRAVMEMSSSADVRSLLDGLVEGLRLSALQLLQRENQPDPSPATGS